MAITGPSGIDVPGSYTWEAVPAGGNGTYSYQWSVYYFNSRVTETLGTDKTQSLDVWDFGHFEMRVTVSGSGGPASDTHFVNNNIGGGPEFRKRPSIRP